MIWGMAPAETLLVFLRVTLFTPLESHRVVYGVDSRASRAFGGIFHLTYGDFCLFPFSRCVPHVFCGNTQLSSKGLGSQFGFRMGLQ